MLETECFSTMRLGLLATLACAALAALVGLSAVRLCAEPLDVSGTYDVPGWIKTVKQRDDFAYPAHAALGVLLDDCGCSPAAVAVQWIKAAAHARGDADVAEAAAGLARARERGNLTAPADDRRLCRYVARTDPRPEQVDALARAGLACS